MGDFTVVLKLFKRSVIFTKSRSNNSLLSLYIIW